MLRSPPQSRSDGDKKDIRKPLGLALTAIGLFFVVFGTLFQAKTSRRREFDADASCVAFTRNNEALGSALRKIAKAKPVPMSASPLHAQGNHQLYGHMYFNDVTSAKPKVGFLDRAKALLATHPPVEDRIARLAGYSSAALLKQRQEQNHPSHIGVSVGAHSIGGASKGSTIGGTKGRSGERIN